MDLFVAKESELDEIGNKRILDFDFDFDFYILAGNYGLIDDS